MKNRKLRDSFGNAFRGIKQGFITERNVRIDTAGALLAILFSTYFKITKMEWALIIFAIIFVVTAELLNTAVEYAIDMVCGNRYNEIAKYAKDIAAGATLIAGIGSAIVGALVFIPYFMNLIN